MACEALSAPVRVGNLQLRNRTIFPPISTNLASVSGEVTEAMVEHYARPARGGVALVTVENVCIDYPAAMEGATQPRCDDMCFVPGLSRLTEAAHAYGALVFVELSHPGLMGSHQPVIAPSDTSLRPDGARPHVLSPGEIEDVAMKFARAALVAQRAGFDGVEIEAAHGLLVNQFLSPLTNKRTDSYGGSTENRGRFAKLVIDAIRELCGDGYTVTARLGVIDYAEGGVRPESDGLALAKMLAEYGYAALHADVGLGDKEKRLEPMAYPQAWRANLAKVLKDGGLSVPVIAVGMIREPVVAERLVSEGTADIVALGRTLVADPDWPIKAFSGHDETVRRCVGCSECIVSRHAAGTAIRCGVNPLIGKSKDYGRTVPAMAPKKVVVVGGGPAGLEAARTAALRGHKVVLFEGQPDIGGAVLMGSVPPGKQKMAWLLEYYRRVLADLKVDVRTSMTVDEAAVMAEDPDEVVVATGSEPLVPALPGIDGPRVLLYTDVLRGQVPSSQRIVVGGGGLVGCETALYLAEHSNSVTIVEMLADIALGMEPISRAYLLRELASHNVAIIKRAKIVSLSETSVRLSQTPVVSASGASAGNGPVTANDIPFDHFVVAFGGKPRLFPHLPVPARVIGDAVKIGRLVDAVRDGYAAGAAL
ncbi:MAG: FAD-dependent oxidoreductase [Acidimicrobiales bacterium]